MRRQSQCLCLLLILASAWVDRFQEMVADLIPQDSAALLGDTVYPVALSYRARIRTAVEEGSLVCLDAHPVGIYPVMGMCSSETLPLPVQLVISSSALCALLMSLQC
jgi:hypothetical protein